jgi:hypothetical protein
MKNGIGMRNAELFFNSELRRGLLRRKELKEVLSKEVGNK